MRLYYDADSESLFWDEFNNDPFTQDVTDEPRFREAAKLQGLIEPERVSEVISMFPILSGIELKPSDRERFWSNVDVKSRDECWPWLLSLDKAGYGQFKIGGKEGKVVGAHRVAFVLANGSVDDHVLHECDNRICCNPYHLFEGTHEDNMKDAGDKGRLSVPRPGNGYTKINATLSEQIEDHFMIGMNKSQIAKVFDISTPTVNDHLKKRLGGFADAVVKSQAGWKRKASDYYPTPVDGTESLIPVLKAMKRPDGSPIKTIWEPACGDGRMARVLEWHGFRVIATDIREFPGYGYGGLDFLRDTPGGKWGWAVGEIDAIVTNPPFSLAEEFIRRALSYTPNVAMLLKQTFWNVGGRSKGLWVDHTPDLELKLTWRLAFLKNERGNSPLMDCMWNVWNGDNAKIQWPGADRQCVTEPIQRLKYQGYSEVGVRSAVEVLEGEMENLTKAIRIWLANLKD